MHTFAKLKAKMFEGFATWCINCALRTPHEHLFHDDGKPHVHRYWLFRIGSGKPDADGEIHPWFAVRACQLVSSEEPIFHDAVGHSFTVVLRGSVREAMPANLDLWRDRIRVVNRFNGFDPTEYGKPNTTTYAAGAVLRRKASDWRFLELTDGPVWLLTITGANRQAWGYLVDGAIKVPWRLFQQRRRQGKR